MQILDSQLSLSAERSFTRLHWQQDRLNPGSPSAAGPAAGAPVSSVDISPEARRLALSPPLPPAPVESVGQALSQGDMVDALDAAEEAARNDPNLGFLIDLLEALTGHRFRLRGHGDDAPDAASDAPKQAPPRAAPAAPATEGSTRATAAAELRRREVLVEQESTAVSAEGLVRTADGQEIRFRFELQMQRSHAEFSETQIDLQATQRKDPLVVNFAGHAAALRDQRFEFDLDSDGDSEALAQLAAGSGFLVFDRNGNGRADDGHELFGARSGDGFAELAALDGDGNGWIDSSDAGFAQLRLWTPDGQGGRLLGLAERGVEAIATANIASPFALRGRGNSDLGQVRATGVYLGAAGAGSVQQVDLSV